MARIPCFGVILGSFIRRQHGNSKSIVWFGPICGRFGRAVADSRRRFGRRFRQPAIFGEALGLLVLDAGERHARRDYQGPRSDGSKRHWWSLSDAHRARGRQDPRQTAGQPLVRALVGSGRSCHQGSRPTGHASGHERLRRLGLGRWTVDYAGNVDAGSGDDFADHRRRQTTRSQTCSADLAGGLLPRHRRAGLSRAGSNGRHIHPT